MEIDDDLHRFILDMDFDEYIPVDNFFDNYLGDLTSNRGQGVGARAAATSRPPVGVAENPGVAQAGDFPTPLQAALGDPNPIVPPPVSAAPASAPAAAQSIFSAPAPAPARSTSEDAGMQEGSDQGSRFNSHKQSHAPGVQNMRSNKFKTERQQALNKAAQQRYRERKKAKAVELEHAVASLQEKVNELSVVQGERDALQERVFELEKQLLEAQTKLAETSTCGGDVQSSASGASTQPNPTLNDLIALYHGDVAALRTHMTSHGYQERTSLDGVSLQDAATLKGYVNRCYKTCVRLHQLLDADVYGMLEASIADTEHRFDGELSMWAALVAEYAVAPSAEVSFNVHPHRLELHISEQTKTVAMRLRSEYISKLENIFDERQRLNLQAVKVLLPDDVGGAAPTKKKWFSFFNYFKRHRNTYHTAQVIDMLKSNLADEQRALRELDFVVYIRLLDPLQSAKCMLATYPKHCDVVSLLNAIGQNGGEAPQ